MTSEQTLKKFIEYSDSLTKACVEHPKIIGLVLVGSAAETERADEWSDHDFFIMTRPGDQEPLRQDLSWLPNSDSIAFSFRETAHGLKVVYKSGAVLEFAIFDCAELESCIVNHHRLAYGDADVERSLRIATAKLPDVVAGDDLGDFRHFLSVLVIQTGRARRGEVLTAVQGIHGTATTALLKVFTRKLSADTRLDKLDVTRRFEFAHPEIGKAVAAALVNPPEQAGIQLLRIADRYLAPAWSEYPLSEVQTIRRILSWPA